MVCNNWSKLTREANLIENSNSISHSNQKGKGLIENLMVKQGDQI